MQSSGWQPRLDDHVQITVLMTDNTPEITIETRQPMRETLTLDAFHAATIVGSVGQLLGNKERLATQSGVASMSVIKTALTATALGITGYSRVLGRKVSQETSVPVSSGTEPSAATPPDVARAQTQLKLLQWAVPAITGALVGVSAYAGEQQRPVAVEAGEQQRPVAVEAGMLKKLTRRGK